MKNNWQTKKLGEICKIQTGRKDVNQGNSNGAYPFFTCASHHTYSDSYSFDTEALLIAGNGDVGNVNFYKGKFEAYQRTYVLTDFKHISPQFLYIYLNGYLKENVSKLKLGNTMPYIKLGMLSNFEVIVPPITKQKEIVDKIKHIFENIEKAKENTEKNLFNCRLLFDKYSQGIFQNVDNSEEIKSMSEVCDFLNGYAFKSKDTVNLSNTQLIRMGNLYKNNLDLERRAVYYPDNFSERYSRYLLNGGDLIISLTGTTGKEDYGYTVRIPKTNKKLLLNQRISKIIILNNKNTSSDYLLYYLLSRTFLDKLYKTAHGTRQANLSTDSIKTIKIGVPDISRQKKIVKKLDELSEQTKKLEENYKQKLLLLDELKKSVLQKAFSGNL